MWLELLRDFPDAQRGGFLQVGGSESRDWPWVGEGRSGPLRPPRWHRPVSACPSKPPLLSLPGVGYLHVSFFS